MDSGEIVTYGDPVLRSRAKEVDEFNDETRKIIERMYQVLAENRGLGLAAPQIGLPKRVFVYDVGEGPHALVNPRILKAVGEEVSIEGCLSIPEFREEVTRARTVTVPPMLLTRFPPLT